MLALLQTTAEKTNDRERLDLLTRVGALRLEENDLQHVGRLAVLAGTREVDGQRVAMLGSSRSEIHVRAAVAVLLRWAPGLLASALRVSGERPDDRAALNELRKRAGKLLGDQSAVPG